MAENERNDSVSQEPSNGDAVNPDVMCQISVSSPSMLLASVIMSSSLAWRTGTMRRECREMDERQRNTMWKSGCGQRQVFSFSLSSAVCRISHSIHPSRWGEKNGCNLFLTPFLNASLCHLHTFDRMLISDVKKARKRQTNWWFAILAELKVRMIHVCHFTCSVLH